MFSMLRIQTRYKRLKLKTERLMLDNKFFKVLLYSLWLKHWSGFSRKVPQRSFKKIRGAAIRNEAGSV